MADLYIGAPVRVLRGVSRAHASHTFTVRALTANEVRVDNGHPSVDDLRRNGFTASAILRQSEVAPWDGEPYLTKSAIMAERITAQAAEIVRLQEALAAAGVEVTRG